MEDPAKIIATLKDLHPESAGLLEMLGKIFDIKNREVAGLLQRIYGTKSEKLDTAQLLMAFADEDLGVAPPEPEVPDLAPKPAATPCKRTPRKERLPEHLPERRTVIDPEEVLENPERYKYIGSEIREKLGYKPPDYWREVIERRKYVLVEDKNLPPVIAPAPPEVIPNSFATVALLVHVIISKVVDHLPLYRQERIFGRHGIILGRKTLCDWMRHAGNWFSVIVEEMKEELRQNHYMQIDETPTKYLKPGAGKAPQGYLWAYHAPGAGVVYEWSTTRNADNLDIMLNGFNGSVQCDGFKAYESYARRAEAMGIEWHGCWAHARRKFHEARNESGFARWMLHQIGLLYAVERRVRGKAPALRAAARASESRMILDRIFRAMRRQLDLGKHLPKSETGKALGYALARREALCAYTANGQVEIDNNLVENAIRPAALGRKNWLFFGAESAGHHAANLLSVVESCRKLEIDVVEYLTDTLERLPSLSQREARELTPAKWLAAKRRRAAA